jgi:hypothetical protein
MKPSSLSRKSIPMIFRRLSPVAWEKLFEREDGNGIGKLRVAGDFSSRVYYDTEGLIHWLIRNAYYTPEQIRDLFAEHKPAPPTIRTHVLAG